MMMVWKIEMGKRISYLFAGIILTVASDASAQSVYPGQNHGKLPVETQVPCKAEAFDLRQVRLLEFSPLYDLNHCRYGVYWDFNE